MWEESLCPDLLAAHTPIGTQRPLPHSQRNEIATSTPAQVPIAVPNDPDENPAIKGLPARSPSPGHQPKSPWRLMRKAFVS